MENAMNASNDKGRRAAVAFLVVLILMCFAIVTLGGYVRLSGSGMAIPEWPLFTVRQEISASGEVINHKSIFPPTTDEGWVILQATFVRLVPGFEGGIALNEFKQMFWIEWGHRGVAKLIGLVFLGYLFVALAYPAVRRKIGTLAVVSLVVLILQAVLGGIVVWFHLSAVKVSIHLVNAFIFTSLLLWALMKLVRPATILNRFASNPILPLATGVFAICLIQLFSGGIMAGSKAGYQINTWPAMGDSMVPPHLWDKELNAYHNFTKNILFVQFFHRWFAFIVAIAVLFLAFRSFTVQVSPVARWALRLAPAIVFLQIVLGVLTLLSQVNHHLALTHQSIGLVLLLTILVVLYETKYHPVLAEEALADRAEAARASKEALHA